MVFGVAGMTCSHCEGQLKLALLDVPAVFPETIKTNVILGRAEFDLNTNAISPEKLMVRIKRVTRFQCTRLLVGNGPYLDVVAPPKDQLNLVGLEKYPDGISDIVAMEDNTLRVFYNAEVIGARAILSTAFAIPLELAPMQQDDSVRISQRQVRRLLWLTLLSAALTIPVAVMAWAPMPRNDDFEKKHNIASLVLATLVQGIAVIEFYPAAIRTLLYARMVEMDMLITMSTTAAYVFSVVAFGYFIAGHPLKTGEFFETSTMLVTLVLVGRLLGELSRSKAANLVSVRSLQVTKANLVTEGGSNVESIDSRVLQYHDHIKILPHTPVVTDGIVVSGTTEIDENMVTGESKLIQKRPKYRVIAGTMNGTGEIVIRVTRLPCENTISQIANMVDKAKLEKPKIQDLANFVAGWFVPIIVLIAIIVFFAQFGVRIRGGMSVSDAGIDAITYAIATLIVSCPCAVGLAVPMVVVIATGVSAKHGIILKDIQAIEWAHDVKHVVFDKTGTLTESSLKTETENILGYDGAGSPSGEEVAVIRNIIFGLVKSSHHPISKAVVRHLRKEKVEPAKVTDTKSIPSKGLSGSVTIGDDGKCVKVEAGNPKWLDCDDDPTVQAIRNDRMSNMCVRLDGKLVAVYGFTNVIRDNAKHVVDQLQKSGIEVHIVSGDEAAAVESVRDALGVPVENTRSGARPDEKQAYVQALLNRPAPPVPVWRKCLNRIFKPRVTGPIVLFCGDGTNDAPALKLATIGVHMPPDSTSDIDDDAEEANEEEEKNEANDGNATEKTNTIPVASTDIASASANVVFGTADLSKVVTLIGLSKSALWRIKLNFVWAGVYNVVAILGASGAAEAGPGAGWRIPPAFAAVGEVVSVLPVILIAVSLYFRRFK